MSDDSDILSIDQTIRKDFEERVLEIPVLKERLVDIEESLQVPGIGDKVKSILASTKKDLEQQITDLESKHSYEIYLVQTSPLVSEYRHILSTPLEVSFVGRPVKKNKRKQKIVQEFLKIASEYTDIPIASTRNTDKESQYHCFCGNKKDFLVMDNDTIICNKCYAQQSCLRHSSSFKDTERVNFMAKYTYMRRTHFRDCIKQYQGKQNSTISQTVYDDLEREFTANQLLNLKPGITKEEKFAKVTKNHVLMFLKQLEYSTHYENVHLIHYTMTGKQPDDISHLEDKLMDDFDQLTGLYDERYKDINRKNFINTQYVLYQLLCRHGHPCRKEDFIILKTIDREIFHDNICKDLFEELKWNHMPYY